MLTFKDIELEDKPIFDRYFQAKSYENSEFTFTNLFIWRLADRLQYAIIHDHLCVIGKYRDLYPYIFSPICMGKTDYGKVLPILAKHFHEKGFPLVLKSVPSEQRLEMEAALPGKVLFREDRDNYDYIYLSKDLIDLRGKAFRQKRNHINKFIKNYAFEYEEMSDNNHQECLKTEMNWLAKRGGDQSFMEEKQAIGELINNFHALEVTGGVIRIHGKVRAFALGEMLNPDMAVVHIEKANTDYDGTFAIINQMFARQAWSNATYINREEDMGVPGLRKAKESYNPVKMVKKYTGFYSAEGGFL